MRRIAQPSAKRQCGARAGMPPGAGAGGECRTYGRDARGRAPPRAPRTLSHESTGSTTSTTPPTRIPTSPSGSCEFPRPPDLGGGRPTRWPPHWWRGSRTHRGATRRGSAPSHTPCSAPHPRDALGRRAGRVAPWGTRFAGGSAGCACIHLPGSKRQDSPAPLRPQPPRPRASRPVGPGRARASSPRGARPCGCELGCAALSAILASPAKETRGGNHNGTRATQRTPEGESHVPEH